MPMHLQVGLDVVTSYKRLSYTAWHAMAEFVDNSTQSYFNNKELLDSVAKSGQRPLKVSIEYSSNGTGRLIITDNAMGMSYEELESALVIARAPDNTNGRSKYGLGLKTAACWIGNNWTIKTKKLGETVEHTIKINVDRIASGDNDLQYTVREGVPEGEHYTTITITQHNRPFKGRTLGKIQQYLRSMYREDFRNGIMTLLWQGKPLAWEEIDAELLQARDGSVYKKNFEFVIAGMDQEDKIVRGWVGVLRKGGRSKAGFSIFHSGRVVRGWPDSWRPGTLYGQEQGSNNLVNQRLVGEIHLDAFDVSHTKDDILWLGDELDQVEDELLEQCGDYKDAANTYRASQDDRRGPTEVETQTAIDEFQKELISPEIADSVVADPMLPEALVKSVFTSVVQLIEKKNFATRFSATLHNVQVKGYIEDSLSPNDPYVTIESAKDNEVIVIVNAAHPHWNQLKGAQGVLNYLRHCTYDGLAEWQARTKEATQDPDTIKLLKDRLLRLTLAMEQHESEDEEEEDEEEQYEIDYDVEE